MGLLLFLFSSSVATAQWTGTNPVTTSSDVGIGLTAPSAKLHIAQSGSFSTGGHSGFDTDLRLQRTFTGSGGSTHFWDISATGSNLAFDYGNATSSMQNVLLVHSGGLESSGNRLRMADWSMDAYSGGTGTTANSGWQLHYGSTGNVLFDQSGRVEIGSSSNPGTYLNAQGDRYLLFVKGGVFSQEFKTELSAGSFPDYVFKPGYTKPTLKEVEQSIQNEHHLPGFQSADYYEKNGLELKSVILQQQKTIEELYLHVLDLQKQVTALQQTNQH